MERPREPFRGFTLAEAVELFRRISAANDGAERIRAPAPSPSPSDLPARHGPPEGATLSSAS
jgi:hypothetical protein